jgi:hypothetical protein
MQRDAIAELSYQIVRAGTPPSVYCAALDLDAAKNKHASLIAQIKAFAIAKKLQEVS